MITRMDKQGFTLIEIVTVVVIIGLMLLIPAPLLFSWMPKIRLQSDARELYSNVQRAKLEAAKRNSCVGIRFTTVSFPAKGGDYSLFVDDGLGGGIGAACNGSIDGGERVIASISVNKDVSLIQADNIGGPSAICFSPTAVVCGSQSGEVQMRIKDLRWYRVSVAASGGTSLQSSSDGISWSY